MNIRLPKTTAEYSSFPMNRQAKSVSESYSQFTRKCPLKCEVSSLLNAAPRLHYVKCSQPKFNTDLLKTLKMDARKSDSLDVHVPINTHKYGLICVNNLEPPNHVVNTNDVGFSRLVDPYLSTTTVDHHPMQLLKHDNITFWNWTIHKHKSFPKQQQSSRAALPPIKKVPYRSFLSEMASQY